jgi:LPXTG-site transpeptidase (sortase) family protein
LSPSLFALDLNIVLERFRSLDRQTILGLAVVAAALVILVIGAAGIVIGLRSDGANLPDQGTISDIAGDNTASTAAELPATDAPQGPPPPAPTRMVIPSLYIDAPVIEKGLTTGGQPDVPERPDQIAWYPTFSAAPGQSNNAVFAGHVDWQTREGAPIPGVFYRLREMKTGDLIEVTLADGKKLQYRVRANVAALYNDPQIAQVMQPTGKDVITIITCGGAWEKSRSAPNGGNYTHRVIVRAERVQALAGSAGSAQGGG